MKNIYRVVIEEKELKHFEYHERNSSVTYWQKYAKNQENAGFFVEMQFEYSTDSKELRLLKYESYNRKTFVRETVYLIKNKEQLARLKNNTKK